MIIILMNMTVVIIHDDHIDSHTTTTNNDNNDDNDDIDNDNDNTNDNNTNGSSLSVVNAACPSMFCCVLLSSIIQHSITCRFGGS